MSLEFITDWYSAHCDGEWEHDAGVRITTLDNPGWRLEVNLAGTELMGRQLDRIVVEESDDDWHQLWSDGEVFRAAGGPKHLGRLLEGFQRFAEGG